MEIETECPYCGEPITVWIDPGGGSRQRYVEDCSVCCRPIEIGARADDDGHYDVDAARDDD